MLAIKFPPPTFSIRQQDVYDEIFDGIRRAWVKLTPEEWVRQNFIAYLQEQDIPASLIGVEKEIAAGELRKRFDIVVYTRSGKPWMLVECKAMNVPLSERTIQQTLVYRSVVPSSFMLITNGHYSFGWELAGGVPVLLEAFPQYLG